MIRKLRRKFLGIAMLSLLGTLAFLVAAIATGNAILSANRADRAIALLYENGGAFPTPDSSPNPALGFDFQVREETPFETRYFIARLSENQEVLSVDTEHIAALDRQTVIESLNAVLRSGAEKGYVDHYYRFGVFADEGGGSTVIVLDCFLQVQASLNMLRVTLLVSLAGALIVFVILLFSSRMAIRPFVENLERQRRFVTDASHELKTPLAAIRLLADSITGTDNIDPDTVREFVSDIATETERLQRTTEKLLDLSRRDDGAHVKSVPVDVGGCAEDTLRRLAPLADKSSITLHCEAEPGCTILAPEDDVYQIVFNLAENAVKYNVPGGRVDVSVRRERGYVLLSVEDTGIGIPEEDLPNIFSRFYRVDKARSRERGGSGLGLSIVHDAVAAMGGKIDVHARESGGTRFTVTFPGYSGKEEAQ